MALDPVAVALKFGFLAVLYLFLLWIARSAMKDLRRANDPRGARRRPQASARRRRRDGPATPRPGRRRRTSTASTRGWSSSARPGTPPGMEYEVGEGAVMGRGDQAEIRLEDPFASSRHARLVRQGGAVVLEDMGSTNGTYLNEELAGRPAAAAPGRPGAHRRLRVHLPGALSGCCASPRPPTSPTRAATAS